MSWYRGHSPMAGSNVLKTSLSFLLTTISSYCILMFSILLQFFWKGLAGVRPETQLRSHFLAKRAEYGKSIADFFEPQKTYIGFKLLNFCVLSEFFKRDLWLFSNLIAWSKLHSLYFSNERVAVTAVVHNEMTANREMSFQNIWILLNLKSQNQTSLSWSLVISAYV